MKSGYHVAIEAKQNILLIGETSNQNGNVEI